MRSHYKSLPVFMQKSANVSESDNGAVIHDVVIIQKGLDKVGDYIDETFIDNIIEMGNAQTQGVKSRFGHPNMCKDSLGTYIGRYRNFRKSDEGHAIADLHLDKVAIKSPEGDLYSYILEMAKKNHDQFGNSIVFSADSEEITLDDGNTANKLNLQSLIASDLVDSPAATTSLFRSTDDLGAALTDFIDENPQVLNLIENPKLLKSFFGRYATYYEKKFKKSFDMGILDRIKAALGGQKNIDVTLADGMIATVITDADAPAVGDSVTVDGAPAPDGEHLTADGTIIITEGGVITEIVAPPEEVQPEAQPTEEVIAASVEKAFAPIRDEIAKLQKSISELVDKQKQSDEALLMIARRTKSVGEVPPALQKSASDPALPSKATPKFVSKTRKTL